MNNKQSLISKLERQDLMIAIKLKALYRYWAIKDNINDKSIKRVFFLLISLVAFSLFLEPSSGFMEDIAYPFFAVFCFTIVRVFYINIKIQNKASVVIDERMKIEKERLLSTEENVNLLFKELVEVGVHNVNEETAKKIIFAKREFSNKKIVESELDNMLQNTIELDLINQRIISEMVNE